MSRVLALEEVTKRYGRRAPWVLSGADLMLDEGTRTHVVGTNGSGKSTLMRIAAGVTSPSGGTASVPRRLGYVPERQAGRSKFTGSEYLAHMARIKGLDHASATRTGKELLDRLGLHPGPDVSFNNLSKGNRQKLVIAQAFLGQPDVVVLDEPYSGLDQGSRRGLDDLIAEVSQRGAAVLVSGHDSGTTAATETYHLVNGRLSKVTSPAGGGRVKVELTHGALRSRAEVDSIVHLEGVVRWEISSQPDRISLDVTDARSDEVLKVALGRGWSVASVHRPGEDER